MMLKGCSAARMLTGPLVVKFIYYQNTQFVAELDEIATIGVMRGADVVHAKLLHQFDTLLDGLWIGCCTQGTKCMMIGVALQQYLLSIQFETEVSTIFNGANAKFVVGLVGHRSVLSQELSLYLI